jgi:hypothetical protein
MMSKRSLESFMREATVLKSLTYVKAKGKYYFMQLYLNLTGFPKLSMCAYNSEICIIVEELLGINLETLRKKH